MIVVDTSVLVAVIEGEPELHIIMAELMRGSSIISAASWIELHAVMLKR